MILTLITTSTTATTNIIDSWCILNSASSHLVSTSPARQQVLSLCFTDEEMGARTMKSLGPSLVNCTGGLEPEAGSRTHALPLRGCAASKEGVTLQMGGAVQKFSIRGEKGNLGGYPRALFNILVYVC